jgi:hypothetical protein
MALRRLMEEGRREHIMGPHLFVSCAPQLSWWDRYHVGQGKLSVEFRKGQGLLDSRTYWLEGEF